MVFIIEHLFSFIIWSLQNRFTNPFRYQKMNQPSYNFFLPYYCRYKKKIQRSTEERKKTHLPPIPIFLLFLHITDPLVSTIF